MQNKQLTIVFVTHNTIGGGVLIKSGIVMAPHLSRVVADISIEASYPRTEEF
ncbi:MAG: hypothetical protein F6K58_29585 [Symploca sp. SIO2E9]|nr:hypothetical protein [Symploca sp. SIO2E9]